MIITKATIIAIAISHAIAIINNGHELTRALVVVIATPAVVMNNKIATNVVATVIVAATVAALVANSNQVKPIMLTT
jgi:hypothetical protein